jgi:DNA-binding MarR family transcriptional regulator
LGTLLTRLAASGRDLEDEMLVGLDEQERESLKKVLRKLLRM